MLGLRDVWVVSRLGLFIIILPIIVLIKVFPHTDVSISIGYVPGSGSVYVPRIYA